MLAFFSVVIYYRITVHTGEKALDPEAKAYVILYGEDGESNELHLEQQGRDVFEINRYIRNIINYTSLSEVSSGSEQHNMRNSVFELRTHLFTIRHNHSAGLYAECCWRPCCLLAWLDISRVDYYVFSLSIIDQRNWLVHTRSWRCFFVFF